MIWSDSVGISLSTPHRQESPDPQIDRTVFTLNARSQIKRLFGNRPNSPCLISTAPFELSCRTPPPHTTAIIDLPSCTHQCVVLDFVHPHWFSCTGSSALVQLVPLHWFIRTGSAASLHDPNNNNNTRRAVVILTYTLLTYTLGQKLKYVQ